MRQKKQNHLGRSMLEMIGVLSIVGILSVGGVTGFQKALHSYRYNKAMDQWAQIIPAVNDYVKQLKKHNRFKAPQQSIQLIPMLKRTKVLPPEMIKNNSNNYIYDALNNEISIYHHYTNYIGFSVWGEGYKKDFYDICRLSLTFGHRYYKTVSINFYKNLSQNYGGFASGENCTSNCLKNLDDAKIIKFCTEWQDVEQPRVIIIWH